MEDWEAKVDKIVEETEKENMTLISGIPPWLIMYFEKLVERHSKNQTDIPKSSTDCDRRRKL